MEEALELPCVVPEQAALEQAMARFDRWQACPGTKSVNQSIDQSKVLKGAQWTSLNSQGVSWHRLAYAR